MRFGITAVLAIALLACGIVAHSVGYASEVAWYAPERAPGDELSFIGPDGGLWLTQIGRGSTRLLLAHTEFVDYHWAPDGRRIAYIASDGGLAALDVVTGRRVRLSDGEVTEVRWAPSGEEVAFVRDQQVWLAALSGGEPRRLTEWKPVDGDVVGRALWTGDGRFVIFQKTSARGARELGVVDLKSRSVQMVSLAATAGSMESAAMTPDGRALLLPHWQDGEQTDAVCQKFGLPVTLVGDPDGAGSLTQVVEVVTFPDLQRRPVACWQLSDAEALETGWLAPVFIRDGDIALVSALDAPSGLMPVRRAGGVVDPRTLNLVSLAEESGRIDRRYPTEVAANGSVAAVVYRQDEAHAQGTWFSFEIHHVDLGAGAARRTIVLRDGCLCPDERSDTNAADLQLGPDGRRIAFTYFQRGVNRVAVITSDGELSIISDGERPIWRPVK